jgi:inner membrane transporter RhtA
LGFYIVLGGKVSKMKDGGCCNWNALCPINCFWNYGNGFSNLTPTFLSLGVALALLSSAIPFTLEMKALGQLPARTFSILMSRTCSSLYLCADLLTEHLF